MRRLLLLTALAAGAGSARAENGVLYLGAGLSHDTVNNITDLANQALSSSSWKALVALRPVKLFAVEADYLDLGSRDSTFTLSPLTCVGLGLPNCSENVHSHGSAYAGFLALFAPLPLPLVDVYAKAGAARWKLNGSLGNFGGPPSSFSSRGTNFAWGVGVQVQVKMFGARLEYENFNIPGTSGGAKIASLSAYLNLMRR
jgi:hypothetical protein